jgi:hypothetical protein
LAQVVQELPLVLLQMAQVAQIRCSELLLHLVVAGAHLTPGCRVALAAEVGETLLLKQREQPGRETVLDQKSQTTPLAQVAAVRAARVLEI